ncbi:MAG: C13 family peptidase [Reyranella sp.]|nr:C13 family peptidase [Reyranella sp.]MDP3162831.1 C13 family peptidase [Reyranella sp.]
MFARLAALAVAFLSAAACTPEAAGTPPPTTSSTAIAAAPSSGAVPAGRWRAVLIAGDNNSPAFDNGVQSLREKLVAHGVTNISVYSSDTARTAPAQLASVANVATALRAGGGDACFVFVTSHGEERGFVLKTDRRLFDPGSLDRVLSAGCGSVPTVVVVSACHSGTFLTAAMRKPNRVILTAAATDRTSFGCGAGDQYTYYDQCLLQQFDGAATWRDLAVATRACVENQERRMGIRQFSLPQTFVGAQVEGLRLPQR